MSGPILALLTIVTLAGLERPAAAIVIEGVDFSDFVAFAVPDSGSLSLSTSQDIYIYAPEPFIGELVDLTADQIIVSQSIVPGVVPPCTASTDCEMGPYDLDRDAVVTVTGLVGTLTLVAGGSIVVASQPLPEPETGLLLALGVGSTAFVSRRREPACQVIAPSTSSTIPRASRRMASTCSAPRKLSA